MRKRIIAVISAFLMISTSCFVSATEGYTPPQVKIYLDGEEIVASPNQMCSPHVPFAAVARKLGYQVSYQESTCEVTAVKGEKTVTIKIGSRIAGIQEGEESIPVMLASQAVEKDGVTYLMYWDLDMLLGVLTVRSYKDSSIHLYCMERYIKYVEENCKTYLDYITSLDIPSEFSSSSQSKIEFHANSNLFGIHINGISDISMNLQKQGTTLGLQLEMKNDGLFHFLDLQTKPAVFTGMEALREKIDLSKPLKANLYLDKDALYLDSETATPIVIYQDYCDAAEEKLVQALERTKNGRIKIGISDDEYVQDIMAPVFTALENNTYRREKEELVESITTMILQSNGPEGYDNVMKCFELIAKLTNAPYFTVNETEKETTVTYKIDAKDLQNLIKSLGFSNGNEQLLQYFNYDVDMTATYMKSNDITVKSYCKIGLSNIPNPYGLEIGSVELIVSEDNQQKIGNQDISKPKDEDYVNYNEIDKIMKGI